MQRVVSESLRLRDALFPRQDREPPPALLPFTNLHVSHGPMMQANVFCLLRVSCPVEVLKSAGVLAARVPRSWRLNSWSRRRLAPTASSSVRHPVFATRPGCAADDAFVRGVGSAFFNSQCFHAPPFLQPCKPLNCEQYLEAFNRTVAPVLREATGRV